MADAKELGLPELKTCELLLLKNSEYAGISDIIIGRPGQLIQKFRIRMQKLRRALMGEFRAVF